MMKPIEIIDVCKRLVRQVEKKYLMVSSLECLRISRVIKSWRTFYSLLKGGKV